MVSLPTAAARPFLTSTASNPLPLVDIEETAKNHRIEQPGRGSTNCHPKNGWIWNCSVDFVVGK
jgi:hypothetical protein